MQPWPEPVGLGQRIEGIDRAQRLGVGTTRPGLDEGDGAASVSQVPGYDTTGGTGPDDDDI